MINMHKRIPFSLSGGQDRSVVTWNAPAGSFYQLLNFRQKPQHPGILEQTPYFVGTTIAAGTTDVGVEAGTTTIRFVDEYKTITDNVIRNLSGQMQSYVQTTAPTTETVNTGCRIEINSLAGAAITLGNFINIEIDGATTFRWKKNGGAWTAGVACSITGTSIDGGNMTVYFLATSGFTIGDAWAWKRTDGIAGGAGTYHRPGRVRLYKDTFYFLSGDDRLFVVKLAGSTEYCITVGYRPVFGTCFTFYQNHLVLGGYATNGTPANVVAYTDLTRRRLVAWSDNLDLENFIPTDTNEADSYSIPVEGVTSSLDGSIIGVNVLGQQLFIFTASGTFYTPYLGLPIVFSFQKFDSNRLLASRNNTVVEGDRVVFLFTPTDILMFDGANYQSIGQGVYYPNGPVVSYSTCYGAYNPITKELVVFDGTLFRLYVYQLTTSSWYMRGADFTGDSYSAASIAFSRQGKLYIGNKSLTYKTESVWTDQPAYDRLSGGGYTTPSIIFPGIYAGSFAAMKELDSVYLAALVSGGSSTYYSINENCQVKLYWNIVDNDYDFTNAAVSDSNAVWINTNSDGLIPVPRLNFRTIMLELRLVGLVAGKPPGIAQILGFEPRVRLPAELVEK